MYSIDPTYVMVVIYMILVRGYFWRRKHGCETMTAGYKLPEFRRSYNDGGMLSCNINYVTKYSS